MPSNETDVSTQGKLLRVLRSMGAKFGVGWERDDVDMIHIFATAAPGEAFCASNGHGGPHWPCEVCDSHGFTEADFYDQMPGALARGPDDE